MYEFTIIAEEYPWTPRGEYSRTFIYAVNFHYWEALANHFPILNLHVCLKQKEPS